jgi:hypothetical protein
VHALAPAALYVLAGHGRQAVVLPKPKVPEGQVWQEVEVPSMKNWPELQHKPVPADVQRTVPPAVVQPAEEHVVVDAAYSVHSSSPPNESPADASSISLKYVNALLVVNVG